MLKRKEIKTKYLEELEVRIVDFNKTLVQQNKDLAALLPAGQQRAAGAVQRGAGERHSAVPTVHPSARWSAWNSIRIK